MPDTLHVLLGANGDLCALFPWMRAEAERTGSPLKVLVARDYVPLFDGVSYAQAVACDCHFTQLAGALRYLKTDLPTLPVKVLQPFLRMEERTLPSFVHEMWHNAGAVAQMNTLPLVFDRRDKAREAKLVARVRGHSRKPMILVAPHGMSSPFRQADELLALVRREFGRQYRIVDLSKVKAQRFYDLLGLYDAAAALVTVDTGHVHLSRASKVPTLVIARDYPQLWDGVPWEARFKFYCRYGQWKKRQREFMEALKSHAEMSALLERGGFSLKQYDQACFRLFRHRVADLLARGTYNPSRSTSYGVPVISARVHLPYRWETRLVVHTPKLGVQPVELPDSFDACSHEDMRLFTGRSRALMASFTLAKVLKNKQARCITAFGELRRKGGHWQIKRLRIPRYGRNNWRGMEKNWVFFSHEGQLHAIYASHPRQVILRMDDDGKVLEEIVSKGPRWAYGEIRGGTSPLPWAPGQWLRFFHSRTDEKGAIPHRYHIGALLMQDHAPFRVLRVTEHPILSGNEEWFPGCHHWKPNVVFPCGATMSGNYYHLSYGVNDAASRILSLRKEHVFPS